MVDICAVGEAWGEQEEREQAPFVGASGHELTKMLGEAGIHRADCFLTNVFNKRPRANKIEDFCGDKAWAIQGYPSLIKGKYVRAEFQPELDRLGSELLDCNANVVIALGNTALWALTGKTAISKLRGTTTLSTHCVTGFKILPTYHPAAVLRQWDLRPVTVIDLMKAKREAAYPEIRRPRRTIWIEPSIEDILEFKRLYIDRASIIAVDIETAGNHITCIGFAPSKELALVVPFTDARKLGRSYWPTKVLEVEAWQIVKSIMEASSTAKVLQNSLYDVAFLWRAYGIKSINVIEDTMLLHHALQPESLKGLAFLASCYCDEGSWKQMRTKHETIKQED